MTAMNRRLASITSMVMGAAALAFSFVVGVAPAQAVDPVILAPCGITSKVITLGHDRWLVRARLYRDGKRYPRHALTLTKTDTDGTVTELATKLGTKKAKWNWRPTGLIAGVDTLQVKYAGDATTDSCEGAVLTPLARPRH
jgi:hypothetical protein